MGNSLSSNKVVAYNLAGKVVLNGINFFVVSVFTRMLGEENYGLFSLYITWQSIVLILVGLQTQSVIGNVTIHYGVEERKRYLSSNTFMVTLVTVLLLLVMIAIRKPVENFTGFSFGILLFMILHSYAGYGVNVVTGVWAFDMKARLNFFVSLLLSLLNIGLSIVLINSITEYSDKYIGRIVGSALPTVVFGIACVVCLIVKGRTLYNWKYWKYSLRFSIPIVFHALSNLILSQSDRIMLQKMSSLSVVGVYSVVFTLVHLLNILMEAFNTAWVPFFYDDLKKRNYISIKEKTKNYVYLFTSLVVGFLLVAPEVLRFYAGDEFCGGERSLPFLAIGAFFVFLYSFPVNYKYYYGETKSIAIGTISAGFCNIILNYILIPKYGIFGASIATMLSYFLLWLFHYIGARNLRESAFPYNISDFLKYMIVVFCIAGVAYFVLYDLWIVRWCLAAIVGIYMIQSIIKRKSIW